MQQLKKLAHSMQLDAVENIRYDNLMIDNQQCDDLRPKQEMHAEGCNVKFALKAVHPHCC